MSPSRLTACKSSFSLAPVQQPCLQSLVSLLAQIRLNALHIFNPEHLESNEDINAAIEVLEGTIDPSNIAVIVAHAMERPFALEFIVSVISQDTFAFLSQWIVAHFPTTLDDYTAKPVSVKALIRLHLSLFSLQLSDAHESDSLWEYMRAVELAQPVLCALSDIVKGTDFLSDTTTSNRKSARRTMSKAASQSKVMVDIKPFRDLDIQVPSNAAAALELAVNILSNQKKILEYFLDVFRRPSLFDTLKDMYMNPPINVPSVPSRQTDIPVVLNSPLVETPIDVPHKSAGQILKATLYHQSADGFGEWRIFLGDKAAKDLRQLRKGDANMLKIVVNKLRELSNGRFSETNQKKITGSQVPLPIFEAKLPGDNRIVYQIDFVQEYEAQFGHQVLNIYGIENHAYISRQFWDKFARTKAHIKGSDYSDLCRLRDHPRHTGDDVFSPMTIPAPLKEELGGEVPLEIANISTKDLADFHSLLVLDKYVAVSQNVLTGLLLDQEHDEEIAHIFRVSPREQEIIEHTGSCYVLGRSGTGKTTTMLFKIFGIERAWIQSGCTDPRPRQIFVTKSRVLAEKVEEYFQRFVRSLAQESEAPHVNDILRRSTLRGERGMVNVEEDIAWRDDLPEKYSELVNSHFPLFITFDNLATMVEADMQNTASSPSHGRKKNSVSADSDNPLLMSYEIFRDEYWPRFPYHVQNGFAPSLVFGEFIGVIKGSQMTLGHKNRVLDRDAYNNLSPRTQPMFADKRNVLYDLFELYKVENRRRDELYMKRKVKNRYRDAADRTHTLLDAIRDHEFPGEKVDFIYVDEVQDLLLIDTLFLRWICKNPNGLFWAGDTAQTISFGSAFRFDDLTSFLHDVEKQSESNIVQGRSTTRKPEFFQLLTNYRSHAGIVNCAHSIIDLIKEFWYDSIDILGRERGIVDGMRPIFVDGWDETQFKLFFAENKDRSVRELGEHQCILVRDDTAREKLEELIGDVGIILTLYESKGLEFDDVLLYNFFEDSAVDENQWRRVIKAAQEGPHAWSYRSAVGTSAPSVGIELKFLYVAVTRTRKKLLFVDQSSIAGPIKQYWVNKGLIDVQSPEDTLSDFASASKPEEWVERARTLFARHQYDQATKAFRRANLPREAAIANAYQLRVLAQRDTKTSVQSFCRAADAFNECASDSSNEKEIKSFFEIAGDCYLESKKYPQAAKAYENARLFTQAISCYLAARLLDEAVSILKIHEETIESGVAERVRNIARCAYLNAQKHKQAMEFFQNEDEMAQFMEDLGFDHAHAVFLERKGDIKASAELYRKEGDTLHAIELLLKDGNHVKQTLEYLLRALWKHLSFGVRYVPTQDQTPSSLELRELFSFLDRLPQDEMSTQEIAEVNMFKAIRDSDMQTLERLAGVLCQSDVVEPAAVLCLHHFFSQQSSLAMGTQEETIVTLQMFQNYVRLMREIIMLPNPVDSEVVQKLFAIQPGSVQGQVVIPMGTFIWKHFDETTPHVSQTQDMHIPPGLFMQEFRQGLIERLRILVESENDSCFRSTVFNPCSKIIVGGRCFRTDCSYAHELDEAWYTRRVRFHLQQICILHIFQSLYTDSFPHRIRLQRFWINRLQDMFHPLSYNCGSASTICIDDIQEARLAFHCINQWVTGILFTLEPNLETLQRPFLTNFLNASAVGYIVNGKTIDDCLDRIPCIHSPLERHPLLLTNGGSSYILFKLRAFMKGHGDGLYKGALFFSYVIEHRVPVHIGAMCHLLDRTCGLFSLRYNYQYKKTLHGITLPRTWLLEHWEDFGGKYGDKASRAYRSVVSPIAQLIEDIYLWDYSDPDLYRKPFDIPRHVAKSICLSRICKAVCLLEYNINDLVLRQDIVRALSSLRAKYPTDVFDAVYAPYVMAKNWDDLARIIRVSMMNSPFDEMVQLISARSIQPTNALRGIRRVVFEKHDDIPLLLDPLPYTRLPTFMEVRTQASSFSSKRTQASSSSNNDSDLEATVSTSSETVTPLVAQTVAQTDEDAENSADADEADEVATSASEESDIMDHVDTGTSEEQLEAVKRVQQIFRRTLKRRNAAAKGGFAASQARSFDACLDQVRAVNWAPRLPYRIVYLGLLPHILLCLEWLKNSATELREGIKKKRTLELSMDELEKSLEDMIMAKNILDRVERLLEMLEPKSSFHDERDLDQFRHFAEEVKGLMNDLSGSKRVPKEDIELVMKGLSPAKTQRIRPKRPELNVEDLDM